MVTGKLIRANGTETDDATYALFVVMVTIMLVSVHGTKTVNAHYVPLVPITKTFQDNVEVQAILCVCTGVGLETLTKYTLSTGDNVIHEFRIIT